ncbi:MAG: hypothetical protein IJT37_07310 [Lachnospiraceae bacterium]|nr:hypothetical protein [Lachnospiraceae bacterium]
MYSELESSHIRVMRVADDLTVDQMADWAEMSGIEAVIIDKNTTILAFKKDLKLGEVFYG